MLEYHWLFALFLRLARRFTGAEGKWTLLPPISLPSSISPVLAFKLQATRPAFGYRFWQTITASSCQEFSKQPLSASILSFSFHEIPPIQAPLVQTSTWPLTQSSLPLSQESCSRPCTPAGGFSLPSPRAGPRDHIVLKHSSYRQIFQCPLSLVSDLHICRNTVGCSLCSSDPLGISLALRGSGLCSHLCCRHLPFCFFFHIHFKSPLSGRLS